MSKINKLGKSTFVIAILSFILVAVLAFGGTYAYFSDSANVVDSAVTLGTLYIDEDATGISESGTLVASGLVVPNQTIVDETATTTIRSNIKYYVRVAITTTFTLSDVGLEQPENVTDETHVYHTDSCLDSVCADVNVTPIIFSISHVEDEDTTTLIDIYTDAKDAGVEKEDGNGILDINEDANAKWFVGAEDEDGTRYLYLRAVQGATDADKSLDTDTLVLDIESKVNSAVGQGQSMHFMNADYTLSITVEICQADYVGDNGVAEAFTTLDEAEDLWGSIDLI